MLNGLPPRTSRVSGAGIRPSLSLDFAGGQLDSRITFTGSNNRTYYDSSGTLQTAGANVPRFDHDPGTGAPRGLLIEGAATNLVLSSATLTDANWAPSRITETANDAVAPDGQTAAERFANNTTGSGQAGVQTQTVTVANATDYTLSVFAKAGSAGAGWVALTLAYNSNADGGRAWFNVTTGVAGSSATFGTGSIIASSISNAGNGWYRISMTVASTATDSSVNIYAGTDADNTLNSTSGDNNLFWGAQLETGRVASSYIATSGSTATRTADIATITDLSWYNAAGGTVLVEFESSGAIGDNSERIWELASDANNSIAAHGTGTAGQFQLRSFNGGLQQFDLVKTWTANSVHKSALAFASNDVAESLDGATATTFNSATIPPVTTLYLGGSLTANRELSGWLRRFEYYRARLPNTVLEQKTGT